MFLETTLDGSSEDFLLVSETTLSSSSSSSSSSTVSTLIDFLTFSSPKGSTTISSSVGAEGVGATALVSTMRFRREASSNALSKASTLEVGETTISSSVGAEGEGLVSTAFLLTTSRRL